MLAKFFFGSGLLFFGGTITGGVLHLLRIVSITPDEVEVALGFALTFLLLSLHLRLQERSGV